MLRVGEGVTQFCRPVSGIAMNAPGVCPAVIPDDRIVERQETVDFASCHGVVPSLWPSWPVNSGPSALYTVGNPLSITLMEFFQLFFGLLIVKLGPVNRGRSAVAC